MYQISKKIKNSVKEAIKFISDFEQTATDLAISNGYDYVICGHIHQPVIKEYWNDEGSVVYLNSGDWVENLTCLEYFKGDWKLIQFDPSAQRKAVVEPNYDTTPITILENLLLQKRRVG